MKKRGHEKTFAQYLRGDSAVSRAYRRASKDVPPAALDERILAESRKTVRRGGISPFGSDWRAPLAVAAVVVLSVVLVLFMGEQGVTPVSEAPLAEKAQAPVTRSDADRARRARSAPAPAVSDSLGESPVPLAKSIAPPSPGFAPISARADVIAVEISGSAGAYEFNVTILSPDTGCDQYADWWEVLSEDGRLLYRRVLAHSHAGEQPFTRAGGPVPVDAETTVWVRAHMFPGGYGGQAMKGSFRSGFRSEPLDSGFVPSLANAPPKPDGCAF